MSDSENNSSDGEFTDIVPPSNAFVSQSSYKTNNSLVAPTNNDISSFSQINNKVFHVYSGLNGKLSVQMCDISSVSHLSLPISERILKNKNRQTFSMEFTELPNKGKIPSVREGFCCSSHGSKHIALIGGSGPHITKTDVYTYNIENNRWKKIALISAEIGTRSHHRVASIEYDGQIFMYVFGGTNGIFFERDLLMFCFTNDSANCSIVECDGPAPSCRIDHSMSVNDVNHSILMFGGKNSIGNVLCDLWALEINNPLDVPRWKLIEREGPPARYSHASFVEDGKLYIAGGFNEYDKPLNDVWCYAPNTGWEQIAIFKSESLNIFGSKNSGLIEISDFSENNTIDNQIGNNNTLFVRSLKLDPTLSLLNNPFEQLRKRQKAMYIAVEKQKEEIECLTKEIQNLKSGQIQTSLEILQAEVKSLRQRFLNVSLSTIQAQKEQLNQPFPHIPNLIEFTDKLQIKQASKTEKFKRRKRELKAEKEMYNSMKKALDVNLISSNCSDSETSKDAKEPLYVEKLRELEFVRRRNDQIFQKIEKLQKKSVEDDELFMKLAADVSTGEEKLTKQEKKINIWRGKMEESNEELEKMEAIFNSWSQNPINESENTRKLHKISAMNQSIRLKAEEELKAFANAKKESVRDLLNKLDTFREGIDAKSLAECKRVILELSPILQKDYEILATPLPE
ncbi:hypothetical protein TRFO_06104 [Tritrichomonas foetus]|uniref:Kelch motif family protein n=1 Tax=Tritrichomonas foetus TaxID=1144522 RepID=A0A1J4K6L6_9EUKA|nr:hypothetical protein TRFO_06104 [Tritrichomonas foetus]|eukprot:OHT05093.1 hypothetical protein TRFO_06104 [Tritrichomonas foetus]